MSFHSKKGKRRYNTPLLQFSKEHCTQVTFCMYCGKWESGPGIFGKRCLLFPDLRKIQHRWHTKGWEKFVSFTFLMLGLSNLSNFVAQLKHFRNWWNVDRWSDSRSGDQASILSAPVPTTHFSSNTLQSLSCLICKIRKLVYIVSKITFRYKVPFQSCQIICWSTSHGRYLRKKYMSQII